ncbi:hypothetical protein FDP25_15360 [Roseovarius sp. A21]|uniref:DUF2007 domain-containing protein n=1 Tax=Roseovarius bejariae TaxID=2576383 RepID=A0A844CXJ1_9RHOB|nr:hypothetical protein [Roseovarius bejariae]MRU16819.1 hypothetical protein [Roseovarius bejariae]
MPLTKVPGLTRIAQVYAPAEAMLLVTALEGAGFRVFVPGFHTLSNVQYLSVALGGVPVMVETARADEAAKFLDALDTETVELLDPLPFDTTQQDDMPSRPKPLLRRILESLFYLFTGTAPALGGRFSNRD